MSDVRSPEDWGDAYAELESTYAAFVDRIELTRADADAVALTRCRESIETAVNTLIGNRIER